MGGDNEDGEGMMYGGGGGGGGGDEMEVSQRQSSSGPRCTDNVKLSINRTGVLLKQQNAEHLRKVYSGF